MGIVKVVIDENKLKPVECLIYFSFISLDLQIVAKNGSSCQKTSSELKCCPNFSISTSFFMLLVNHKHEEVIFSIVHYFTWIMKKFLQQWEKGNWRPAKARHLCFEKVIPRPIVIVTRSCVRFLFQLTWRFKQSGLTKSQTESVRRNATYTNRSLLPRYVPGSQVMMHRTPKKMRSNRFILGFSAIKGLATKFVMFGLWWEMNVFVIVVVVFHT